MSSNSIFTALTIVFASTALFCAEDVEPLKLWQFREVHLAVDVELRVYAAEEADAKVAAQAAYARIDDLNRIFSDYDAESEISRLSRTDQSTKVSPELWFLLTKSQCIHEQTDGAFDVTIGPLIKQWPARGGRRNCRRRNRSLQRNRWSACRI